MAPRVVPRVVGSAPNVVIRGRHHTGSTAVPIAQAVRFQLLIRTRDLRFEFRHIGGHLRLNVIDGTVHFG